MIGSIKAVLYGWIPFGHEASLILSGYLLFLIALLIFRQSVRGWGAALPTLIVGVVIEVIDITLGQGIVSSLRDLLLFALVPVVTVFVFRMGWAS